MKSWKVLYKLKVENGKLTPIESELRIDKIVQILLENRGIKTKKEIDEFLNPRLDDATIEKVEIHKLQLKKAINRIKKAVDNKETIIIYGDYDVDGICGTAILWETIYSEYKNVKPYIPHRVNEGYGLSSKGISNIQSQIPNAKLIITVDNGIVAHKAVEFANKQGLDVIITDHHVLEKKLPNAHAIVHTTKLCGAGVAYLFATEISNNFQLSTFNSQLFSHLELVAIATVADLVPLKETNRTFLKFGLENLQKTTRVGLLALFKEAGIKKDQIGVYEIGHMIAPRINAMGRVSHALDSLRLLCTKNPLKAEEYAKTLGITNRDRQLLTSETSIHASAWFNNNGAVSSKIIFVSSKEYNQGVIGLVASKLVEEFYKPAFVLAIGDTHAKGSARSIKGVNVIELIRSVSHTLVQAGGHPMAAGFTVEITRIEEFKAALEKKASEVISDELFNRTITIDMPLSFKNISFELYNAIQQLAPFGMGNPEPTFMSEKVVIEDMRLIGKEQKHVKLVISQGANKFEAIAFGMGSQSNGFHIGDQIDIVYSIDENIWQGNKKLQLKIKDIRKIQQS